MECQGEGVEDNGQDGKGEGGRIAGAATLGKGRREGGGEKVPVNDDWGIIGSIGVGDCRVDIAVSGVVLGPCHGEEIEESKERVREGCNG